MTSAPRHVVDIIEVGPRDGLQNEGVTLSTNDKLALIDQLIGAGLRRIEVTSLVNPRRVPQMADADEVLARLPAVDGVSYSALVLNERGFTRLAGAAVHEMCAVAVSSDTFAMRNQNQRAEESAEVAAHSVGLAKAEGLKTCVTLAAAFGCPFEGEVAVEQVQRLAAIVAKAAPDEIAIADTIGVGDPWKVKELVSAVSDAAAGIPLRAHFHDTRNTGLANAYAAWEAGVRRFDASVGGAGGCPFAPAATGNIATEDLAYMFARGGIETGVSIPRTTAITGWLSERLDHALPARLAKAGPFPTPDEELAATG